MSEPIGALTTGDGNRTYYNPITGKRVPSVTTITNILAAPGLEAWKRKKVAERAYRDHSELGDFTRQQDAVDWLLKAPSHNSSPAAVRGTQVHKIAENMINGIGVPDDEITPQIKPYVDGYLQFLEDHKPEFHSTELSVVNSTVGYGGSFDFRAELWSTMGSVIIGDWKTGATGPYLKWAYQLAAYTRAEHVLYRKGDELGHYPMPPVDQDRALVVQIYPGGYITHWIGDQTEVSLHQLYTGFKSACILYRLDQAFARHEVFRR